MSKVQTDFTVKFSTVCDKDYYPNPLDLRIASIIEKDCFMKDPSNYLRFAFGIKVIETESREVLDE